MPIAIQLSNLGTTEDGEFTLVPTDLMDTIHTLLSKPTRRITKFKKDPSKPKKPLNAYMRWLGENRDAIKESLEEGSVEDVKPKHVLVEAGEQWKLVSQEDRLPFVEAYEADKLSYDEKMSMYSPPQTYDIFEDTFETPEAPPNWNGPELWMYLKKCVKGVDGKALKFQDFDEAVSKANELEECGGITKTMNGYSLRIGPTPRPNDIGSRSGMASWIKSPSKTEILSIYDQETSNEETIEPHTEDRQPKKKNRKKEFRKKEPEPESEDEELDVEEVDIDGKQYYKDGNGIVYDPESSDEVGKYVDGIFVAN